MMPPEAVRKLRLVMPGTTSIRHPDGSKQHLKNKSLEAPLGSSSFAPLEEAAGAAAWPGCGALSGGLVTADNRLEFVYRKLEGEIFLRIAPQLTALRRGLFEVIPQEIFSVFDHREFTMLLNGYHTSGSSSLRGKSWL